MFHSPPRRPKAFSLQYNSPWACFVDKARVQIQRKNKWSIIKGVLQKKLGSYLSFPNCPLLTHTWPVSKYLCLKIYIILIIKMILWFLSIHHSFLHNSGLATCLEITEVGCLQRRRELFYQVSVSKRASSFPTEGESHRYNYYGWCMEATSLILPSFYFSW